MAARLTDQLARAKRVGRRVGRRARRRLLRGSLLRVVPVERVVDIVVDADGTDRGAREAARVAHGYSTPTAYDIVAKYFDGYVLNGRGDERWKADYEWLSFPRRSIITRETARVPREVAPRLRSGKFDVTFDTDFEDIIEACRDGRSSWITDGLIDTYRELDELGLVATVAVRHEGELAAGGWGLAIGGCFCGMSMFHRVSKAGGVALGALVHDLLTSERLAFIDCVVHTPHSERFGAREVDASEFQRRLLGGLERYRRTGADT